MFAREQKQEYDPASVPVIERPLAKQVQGNAYGGSGLDGLRSQERGNVFGNKGTDSKTSTPLYSPTRIPLSGNGNALANNRSPSKNQISPTKSALSNSGRFNPKSSFDPENGTWSDDNSGDERELPEGRSLHRHAKSVTFDAAPPQINEYEMTTPDMSSVGTGSRENSYDSAEEEDEEDSYNRGESVEREDSFDESLEDTDKTPVVGPEDWRHASPSTHHGLAGRFEDPFDGPEGSPMPEAGPSSPTVMRPGASRVDSNGDHRPLPPLPGLMGGAPTSPSSPGMSAAAERASSAQRGLPSPPKASMFSKTDIQGLAGGKMSLEERLRLMMVQDDEKKPKTAAEQQRERRMRRAAPRERSSATPEREHAEISIHEDEDTLGDMGDFQLPQRISRESILRKVNGQESFGRESDYNFDSPAPSSSPERHATFDPDVPIPSTEDVSVLESETAEDSVIVKAEDEDDGDLYSITDMYDRTESQLDDHNQIGSMVQKDLRDGEDLDSQYSDPTPTNRSPILADEDGPPTPRAISPITKVSTLDPTKDNKNMALPEFAGFLNNSDFGLSLQSYMTPSPPPIQGDVKVPDFTQSLQSLRRPTTPSEQTRSLPKPQYDGSGWGSDEYYEEEEEPGTPDSVIRHPILMEQSPSRDSPVVEEHVATIKSASGSRLKTRPSATPTDLQAMREARRQISGEIHNIPPIPERHRNRPSLNLDRTSDGLGYDDEEDGEMERKPSFKKKSLTLDIGSDLGLGLDKDFDRVIEAQKVAFNLSCPPEFFHPGLGAAQVSAHHGQSFNLYANITPRKQRGYLMRQNTKVVVASSDDKTRGTRSAGNSPIKQDRPQSWTVEPWNGNMRRKSIRDNGSPRKKASSGPAPPLPGQESNVHGLGSLVEEEASIEPGAIEGGERGRLFVKVIGVKDLDLPLPKSKSCHIFLNFVLTYPQASVHGLVLPLITVFTVSPLLGLSLAKMHQLAKSLSW